MKLKAILLLPVLVLTCACQAQLFTSTPPNPPQSLSDVANFLLTDPRILVEIHATDEQVLRAAMRSAIEPVKAFYKGRASDKDADPSAVFANWKWDSSYSAVKMSDLSASQRRRLDELALQQSIMASLLTDEIGLALRITPTQRKTLLAMDSNYNSRWAKLFTNSPMLKSMGAVMEKMGALNADSNSDPTPEQIDQLFDKFTDSFAKAFSGVSAQAGPISREYDKRALKVLTAKQQAQLRRMQGKRMK